MCQKVESKGLLRSGMIYKESVLFQILYVSINSNAALKDQRYYHDKLPFEMFQVPLDLACRVATLTRGVSEETLLRLGVFSIREEVPPSTVA